MTSDGSTSDGSTSDGSAPPLWRVAVSIVLLAMANAASFLDRAVFNLILIDLHAQLQLSHLQVGLLGGTAFALVYGIMAMPMALLGDVLVRDRRVVLCVAMAVFSASTALCALPHFATLFICRMTVGFGEAALVPCAHAIIAESVTATQRGRALSAFTLSSFVGIGSAFFVASAVTAADASASASAALRPWQVMFLALGAAGTCAALLMWAVHEPRRTRPGRAPVLRALLRTFGRQWRILACVYAATVLMTAFNSPWLTFNLFFFRAAVGLPPSFVSYVLGWAALLLGPMGALAAGMLGHALERRGHRSATALLALLGATAIVAVSCARVPLAGWPIASLMLAAAHTFFDAATFSLSVIQLQRWAPAGGRGLASALLLTSASAGILVGPLAVGLLADHVFARDIAAALRVWALAMALPVLVAFAVVLGVSRATAETVERPQDEQLVALGDNAGDDDTDTPPHE